MRRFAILLAIATLLASPETAWCKTVYARMDKTSVLSGPNPSASLITHAKKGEPLAVIGTEGRYYHVRTGEDKKGFVLRIDVTNTLGGPEKSGGGKSDLDQLVDTLGGGNQTVSMVEARSSHAIRGMRKKESGKKVRLTESQAEGSVRGMERFSVDDAQLEAFQKEGKVGDSAKGAYVVAPTIKAMRPMTIGEEQALGHEIAREVFLKYGPRVRNHRLNIYVNLVGKTIAAKSDRPDMRYHFAILENRVAGAFSAPGGYVFVTTGLIGKLNSEAQLAASLGHEIAHVAKMHIVDTIRRSMDNAGTAGMLATSQNQKTERIRKWSGFASDILFKNGLDANLEYEADKAAVSYAASAGYNADGLLEFLRALQTGAGENDPVFFQTHPPLSDRIARLEKMESPRRKPGRNLVDRFARWVDKTE